MICRVPNISLTPATTEPSLPPQFHYGSEHSQRASGCRPSEKGNRQGSTEERDGSHQSPAQALGCANHQTAHAASGRSRGWGGPNGFICSPACPSPCCDPGAQCRSGSTGNYGPGFHTSRGGSSCACSTPPCACGGNNGRGASQRCGYGSDCGCCCPFFGGRRFVGVSRLVSLGRHYLLIKAGRGSALRF
jgi:hypothetical protein